VPEQSLLKGEIMAVTILLVEDDSDTAEIMRLYLQHEGYRVLMATNGVEALLQAKEMEADLIILDLMLPSADGLDLGADDYISKPFRLSACGE
jgi:DNA-binding response OmpR family regulator